MRAKNRGVVQFVSICIIVLEKYIESLRLHIRLFYLHQVSSTARINKQVCILEPDADQKNLQESNHSQNDVNGACSHSTLMIYPLHPITVSSPLGVKKQAEVRLS
jgi:hypothetical protein